MDFEIVMTRAFDDSPGAYEIVYAYDNISSIPMTATIGLEDVLGTRATAVVNNGDASGTISDGMAICFDWASPAIPAVITYQVEVVADGCPSAPITNTVEHAVDNPGSELETVDHDVFLDTCFDNLYLPTIFKPPGEPNAAKNNGPITVVHSAIWASILIGIVLPAGAILHMRS